MNDSFLEFFINKIDPKYPVVFIDIGAMGGLPLKWKRLGPALRVIGFEPDSRGFQSLVKTSDSSRNYYFNCALSDRSQDLEFYVTKMPGRSSLYKPNEAVVSLFPEADRYTIVKKEMIPAERVKTLDSVVQESKVVSDVDFIKIDTQGSELAVLEGAKSYVLSKIFGIQIEVDFAEIYHHQPLFPDIQYFMDQNGFQLMDLRRQYWKRKDYYDFAGKGQLIFGDALYFKKMDVLFEELLKPQQDASYVKSKIYKMIIGCLIYRMSDYAVSMANQAVERNFISSLEHENLIENIKDFSKTGLTPQFPGRAVVYKILNYLGRKLGPTSYLGWSDSDRSIGNVEDNK